jgi:CBS domain-containing protein
MSPPIAKLASRDVITVPPELMVDEVAAILLGGELDEVPVLDGAGKVIGRVTLGDLLRHKEGRDDLDEGTDDLPLDELRRGYQVHGIDRATARDVMSPPPPVLSDATPVDRAARRLARLGASHALVSHRGRLVGELSTGALLRWMAQNGGGR